MIKLDDGEDFFPALERAMDEFGIRSGAVISGIGMLKNFKIGYFDQGIYKWAAREEPRELVAMHGSISTAGDTVIHIHVGLAGPDHDIIGGHLKSADVCVVNEILIKKFDDTVFSREEIPGTGLKGLRID